MMKKIMIAGFWAAASDTQPAVSFEAEPAPGKQEPGRVSRVSPDTYEAYPSAVNSYINDHAAFRNLFLSLNSMINLKLFGYADSQDVIVEKDGWYFCRGQSLYALGTQPFADDAAWIGGQIIKAAGYYESRGIPFLMMIAPNKEGIYRNICRMYISGSGMKPARTAGGLHTEHSDVTVLDPGVL